MVGNTENKNKVKSISNVPSKIISWIFLAVALLFGIWLAKLLVLAIFF